MKKASLLFCLLTIEFLCAKAPLLEVKTIQSQVLLNVSQKALGKDMLFILFEHNTSKHIQFRKENQHLVLYSMPVISESGAFIPQPETQTEKPVILEKFKIFKKENNSFQIDISSFFYKDWKNPWKTLRFKKNTYKSMEARVSENELMIKTFIIPTKEFSEESIHFSISFLPEKMPCRKFDHRFGFYAEDQRNVINQKVMQGTGCITRWSLEKNFPNQRWSEPKKPIKFYLSPYTPKAYKASIKEGVLQWNPAFKAIGFKNPIEIVDSNLKQWDTIQNSVRFNLVKWKKHSFIRGEVPQRGGTASNIIDLRTGEILRGVIGLGDTASLTSQMMYFIRVAAIDNSITSFPLSDETTAKLLEVIAAHEMGHILGLMDANYGEGAYSLKNIQDKNWLEKVGHNPSVMSYGRELNLLQTNHNIPIVLLLPKVGPTDYYQIKYAYGMVSPNSSLTEEEFLSKIVEEQKNDRSKFVLKHSFIKYGPQYINEVVETNDPVASMKLALLNLKKTIQKIGRIHIAADKNYREILTQKTQQLWYFQMRYVLSVIGGVWAEPVSIADGGILFTPISKQKQTEALRYLLDYAFQEITWLRKPHYLQNRNHQFQEDELFTKQKSLLKELLNPSRFRRILMQQNKESLPEDFDHTLVASIHEQLLSQIKTKYNARSVGFYLSYLKTLTDGVHQKKSNYAEIINMMEYSEATKAVFVHQLLAIQKEFKEAVKKEKSIPLKGFYQLALQKIDRCLS